MLKLHGSLNWAIEKQSQKIHPIHFSSYFEHYNHFDHDAGDSTVYLPIGSQFSLYFDRYSPPIVVEPEPVIVPPSWNKADYHSALSDVWAAAAKHLSEAEQIFILGYSLPETDSFFRHLYALGCVGNKPLRRIAVYNPDEATNNRFKALLGPGAIARYEFHPMTFQEAIDHIKALFPGRK